MGNARKGCREPSALQAMSGPDREGNSCALCAALDDGCRRRLCADAVEYAVPAGTVIIQEGTLIAGVTAIVGGMAMEWKRLGDGRRQVIGFPVAGELLTYPSASNRAEVTSIALTVVELCSIDHGLLREIYQSHPAVAGRLLALCGDAIIAARRQMLWLGRMTASERVAAFLVDQTRRQGHTGAGALILPMRRGDIADYLGLQIETVSRILSRFKSAGLIDMSKPTELDIMNIDALVAMTQGSE